MCKIARFCRFRTNGANYKGFTYFGTTEIQQNCCHEERKNRLILDMLDAIRFGSFYFAGSHLKPGNSNRTYIPITFIVVLYGCAFLWFI
jgi:hypothetical protein